MYRVFLSPKAAKFLEKSPREIQKRTDDALLLLSKGKFQELDVKKLADSRLFRKRIGDYRIIFEIDNENKVLVVYRIGHRKDVYY